MKIYLVRMLEGKLYSYHEVSVSGLSDLSRKCKELIRDNPNKVLIDFEVKGPHL